VVNIQSDGTVVILVTICRAKNMDNKQNLVNVWNAINNIAKKGVGIFFPIHT